MSSAAENKTAISPRPNGQIGAINSCAVAGWLENGGLPLVIAPRLTRGGHAFSTPPLFLFYLPCAVVKLRWGERKPTLWLMKNYEVVGGVYVIFIWFMVERLKYG